MGRLAFPSAGRSHGGRRPGHRGGTGVRGLEKVTSSAGGLGDVRAGAGVMVRGCFTGKSLLLGEDQKARTPGTGAPWDDGGRVEAGDREGRRTHLQGGLGSDAAAAYGGQTGAARVSSTVPDWVLTLFFFFFF